METSSLGLMQWLEVRGGASTTSAKVKRHRQMGQQNYLGRAFRVEISGARLHLSGWDVATFKVVRVWIKALSG